MAELLDFLPSIGIGTQVSGITGKADDGFTAGGFSAFVMSVTGKNPTLVRLQNNRAQLVLDEKQAVLLRKWLDRSLGLALAKPKTPPTLDIQMNPVLVPWILKYAVPAALLLFVAGWIGHYYLSR